MGVLVNLSRWRGILFFPRLARNHAGQAGQCGGDFIHGWDSRWGNSEFWAGGYGVNPCLWIADDVSTMPT